MLGFEPSWTPAPPAFTLFCRWFCGSAPGKGRSACVVGDSKAQGERKRKKGRKENRPLTGFHAEEIRPENQRAEPKKIPAK